MLAGIAGSSIAGPSREQARHDGLVIPQVVNAYLPDPAYVVDCCWNVMAANSAARLLLGSQLAEGNYLRLLFTDPSFRRLFPDWERDASDTVARFRAHSGGRVEDPEVSTVIDGLRRDSEEFTRLWDQRVVADGSCLTQAMDHPGLGLVGFTRVTLDFTRQGGFRLVLLLSDPATRELIATRWAESGEPVLGGMTMAA
ncbi:hypothetical protein [Streptomyces sp. NPDC003077]|uniref:MmyB family transcriptional regulator n=1 Tax=Streptomyces sp. NPDC003077 TaxID=3154443 RepID=UPI0033A4E4F2